MKSLKPFDLKAALAGAPVRTRAGKKITSIFHAPEAKEYPVIAIIDGDVFTFTATGRVYGSLARCENHRDLFLESTTREAWVNVYDGVGRLHGLAYGNVLNHIGRGMYLTEAEAKIVGQGEPQYITSTKITWEE